MRLLACTIGAMLFVIEGGANAFNDDGSALKLLPENTFLDAITSFLL